MGGDKPRRLHYSPDRSGDPGATLRTALTIASALALTGCVNTWTHYGIPDGCEKVLAFTDADGDGWGAPETVDDEGEVVCLPLESGSARNDRDCDDTAETGASVTGRVGSLCPDELVSTTTDFTPTTVGSEFVLVHPDTEVVWAGAAEQACGPFGWGGKYDFEDDASDVARPGLATFRDRGQLETVLGTLPSGNIYAGFVGFHPTLHQWGAYDDAGTWVQEVDGGDFAVSLCNCLGDGVDLDTCDDRYTEDLGYLALIRDAGHTADGGDWCLGTPEEALPDPVPSGAPAYDLLNGHFICERAIPDPGDWALAVPDDEAAAAE